jgi:hypothetical protein
MFDIPLRDACMSEVLARVSYQVIVWHYRHYDYDTDHGPAILLAIAHQLGETKFSVIQTWVYAYHREVTPMTPTKFVRDAFISRARRGWAWRRVVYPQYKSHRLQPPC